MMVINCGRGSGEGLKIQSASNNAESFLKQYKSDVLQLVEGAAKRQEKMRVVIPLDDYIIVMFSKQIVPKIHSNTILQKRELRQYNFSQIFIMPLKKYVSEIMGRLASPNIESYLYSGDDAPLTITPEEQIAMFYKADNQKAILLQNLNAKEKLQYAYIGILFHQKKLKKLYSERFSFEELITIIGALLPFNIHKEIKYMRNEKEIILNNECQKERNSNEEEESVEMQMRLYYEQEMKLFFHEYPNLEQMIRNANLYEIERTYQTMMQQEEYKGSIQWNRVEQYCKKGEKESIGKKQRKRSIKNAQRKEQKKESLSIQSEGISSGKESVTTEELKPIQVYPVMEKSKHNLEISEIERVTEGLIRSYSTPMKTQFQELYLNAYRNWNLQECEFLQNKIRMILIKNRKYALKKKEVYFRLLTSSCEILPERYIEKRKNGSFEVPIIPIDFALVKRCINDIFSEGLNCTRKRERFLIELEDWILENSI